MKRALIIEDESKMNFRAIDNARQYYLNKIEFIIARSIPAAQNALKLARNENKPFDIIILDVMMEPDPYSMDETKGGTETGWIFYQRELKKLMSVKIFLWTRIDDVLEKKWGENVYKKKRKSNDDNDIVNLLEGE